MVWQYAAGILRGLADHGWARRGAARRGMAWTGSAGSLSGAGTILCSDFYSSSAGGVHTKLPSSMC